MVIFTYAPAGLGHLRVTDALYHGLPSGVTPVILGAQDEFIRVIHRFMSISPWARAAFEWAQNGVASSFFTWIYRAFLRSQTNNIYKQMVAVTSERIDVPRTVVVVATYIGMAHQLGAIKQELMKKLDIRIILLVQVTDDSPQYLWYVQGADLILVPSEYTKRELQHYGKEEKLVPVQMAVSPYPVSPILSEHLSEAQFHHRKQQITADYAGDLHISVPISGAAVGTDYNSVLMQELHMQQNNVIFHCVARSAPFTQAFLADMTRHTFVDLHTSNHDRTVVDSYEQIFKQFVIALEITKPSEQAFKVLLEPKSRGGSILLFTMPVGRQEYDNLNFMDRHHLIPWKLTHQKLYHAAQHNRDLDGELKEHVEIHAKRWRGLILPKDPIQAAQFVAWCVRQRVFSHMLDYTHQTHRLHNDYNPQEIGSDGVAKFWQHVESLVL